MRIFSVRLLYIYKFLSECLPIYAFYTVLFMERGQSHTDVAILIALWSVFAIAFEVPSGILADRWNRRNMLAISAALQGLCYIIWFFSHTFLMFALGFIFWGVSGAFASGTEEGLIYDNLKSDGNEEAFGTVYGRAKFFSNIGVLFGIISAGIIANFISISTIALISAGLCFINIMLIIQIREKNYYSERLNEKSGGFFDTFKEAGKLIKGNTVVLISIIFLVLFASLGSYLDEFDALIIGDFKLGYIWVSVILTVRFVFIALGNLLAPLIKKKFASIKRVFMLNALAFVFLLFFSIIWNQYAFLFFGLSFMLVSVTEILLIDAMQNEIKEEGRSTVMSFYSAGQNLVMICLSLIYALLAGIFTLQQVYIIISVYGVMGGFGFYMMLKIKNRA